jgi:hypothetical protein
VTEEPSAAAVRQLYLWRDVHVDPAALRTFHLRERKKHRQDGRHDHPRRYGRLSAKPVGRPWASLQCSLYARGCFNALLLLRFSARVQLIFKVRRGKFLG